MNAHLPPVDVRYYQIAQKLSAVLGRKWGVVVEFGHSPKTDGTTVYLPHWDLDDPTARTALYGCIAHEAGGHVAQTDFDLLTRTMSAKAFEPSAQLFKSIVNICEDIRIEHHLHARYPGVKVHIDAAIKLVIDRVPLDDIDPADYWPAVVGWLLNRFRSNLLGQTMLQHRVDVWEPVLSAMVDKPVLANADVLGERILQVGLKKSDFALILEISQELLDLFMQARPSQNQPDPQDQDGDGTAVGSPDTADQSETSSSGSLSSSDDDQEGDGKDQSGGTEESGSSDGDTDAQNDDASSGASSSSDDDGEATGEPQAGGSDGSDTSARRPDNSKSASAPQPSSPDQASGASGSGASDQVDDPSAKQASASQAGHGDKPFQPIDANEDLPSEEGGDLFEEVKDLAASNDDHPLPVSSHPSSNKASGAMENVTQHLSGARPLAGRLIPALAPLLVGDMFVSVHARKGRNIDCARLVQARTEHQPRVFSQRVVEDDQSVSMALLIDRSSSTKGEVYTEITKAALGLSVALETFPEVETSICHFPTKCQAGHTVTKQFDETVQKAAKNWPASEGGTPLAPAYKSVALQLLASEKTRRIMITITDGDPADVAAVRRARDFVRRFGIEIYGVVVKSPGYPRELFDDSESISSCQELPAALSRLVLRLL